MRRLPIACVGLLLISGLSPALPGQGSPATSHNLELLGWLSGGWRSEGTPEIEEYWMSPKGGAMLGLSRTVAKGKLVGFEFLRIEAKGEGIDYVASPGGGPATRFRLLRATASEAVFENLTHDFPKRIIYRLQPDGSLLARIEGDGTEREKPQEFRYRRFT